MSVTKYILILYALLFFNLLIQAQEVQSAAVIDGLVIDKQTQAPLKSAHVIYTRIDPAANTDFSPLSRDTDSEGHFSLQLQAGTYRVWVERTGFARQVYGALSPAGEGTTISLARAQQVKQVVFRMVPLGAIAGRIADEDGEPLQSVSVQVMRFSYANGHRQLISVSGASSNDRGEYRIFGLPAGRYLLQASLPNSPMSRPFDNSALAPEAQDSYAASYYPGVVDVDSASAVPLGEGSQLSDIDFHLSKIHALIVRGHLAGSVMKLASGQLQVVLAHNENGMASHIDRISAFVDAASGKFEVHGVTAGSYLLVASQFAGGHALGGRIPVEISANVRQEIALPLTQAFEMTGNVVLDGAQHAGMPALTIRLTSTEGLALGPQPAGKVAGDGSFRLAGVTPSRWAVSFDALPEGMWVKSVSFADNEAVNGELNITESSRGQLRIVLAGNGARISGTVTSDNQPSHATVVLVPAAMELRNAHHLYKVTNTSEIGVFTLKGVAPGAYKLFAFQEISPFEWFDQELLKQVEDMGSSLTVADGENAMHDTVAIPPDALLPR